MVLSETLQPITEEAASFPKSIDVNPTAKCNLDCPFCWGPDHSIPDGLDTQQWFGVMDFFAENGTENIVFTGGEPLVRKDLPDLMRHAKEIGLHTTLSTNTLLLKSRGEGVLPYVDEIGIPLDGSTPSLNSRMRVGNPRGFDASIAAIEYVGENYPDINMTVRTVVSKINKDDIVSIGKVLEPRGRYIDRWKLYQFTPLNMGEVNQEMLEVTDEEFEDVVTSVTGQIDLPITAFNNNEGIGRYVFIGPQGDLWGVGEDNKYQVVSNFLTDTPQSITEGMVTVFNSDRNARHAHEQKE